VDFYHSDVEYFTPPEWPEDAVFRGHEGIRRGAALWAENFNEYRWDIERLIDAGGCVVGLYHHRGRIKTGGAWVESPVGAVFYMRDGKIARVATYFSWAEALRAARIEE
jgi:ketosteroid isomerase-like protein